VYWFFTCFQWKLVRYVENWLDFKFTWKYPLKSYIFVKIYGIEYEFDSYVSKISIYIYIYIVHAHVDAKSGDAPRRICLLLAPHHAPVDRTRPITVALWPLWRHHAPRQDILPGPASATGQSVRREHFAGRRNGTCVCFFVKKHEFCHFLVNFEYVDGNGITRGGQGLLDKQNSHPDQSGNVSVVNVYTWSILTQFFIFFRKKPYFWLRNLFSKARTGTLLPPTAKWHSRL